MEARQAAQGGTCYIAEQGGQGLAYFSGAGEQYVPSLGVDLQCRQIHPSALRVHELVSRRIQPTGMAHHRPTP